MNPHPRHVTRRQWDSRPRLAAALAAAAVLVAIVALFVLLVVVFASSLIGVRP